MTHPADTSEELRDILAQEFSANGESGYADAVFGGKSDPIIKAALAAMSRVRSTRGAVEALDQTTRDIINRLASDLEVEIENRYAMTKDHPAMKRRYDRDMATVIEAKSFLSTASQPQPEGLSMADGHSLTEADNG